MFKPSRRAVVIAASFALGLSCVGPYAQAGLLDGSGGSESMAVEGVELPLGGTLGGSLDGLPIGGLLGGDLLGGLPLVGPLLGGGLLGGDLLGGLPLVGGLLGGGTQSNALGGDLLGGLPLVGDVLGGGGGLPLVGDVLGGGGLPLVGDVLGGGGLPLVGDVLGGGGLPLVGDVLGGDGGLPIVGGLLEGDLLGGDMLSVVTDTTLACDAAIPQVLGSLLLGELTETICAPFDNGILGLLSSL